jgi:cyclopropane fatty-acyl-phospholipid synthase-like methyltransferase
MDTSEKQKHWENIYSNKALTEVSWYQATPTTSLALIESLTLNEDAAIVDVGGGDSFLMDNLLEHGFEQLTVVDISQRALERAKARLGQEASKVQWIQADIASFSPEGPFDCWHDRAAFHFLTTDEQVAHYVEAATNAIRRGGYLILATFAEDGPSKCSGLDIRQYSAEKLDTLFPEFELIKSMDVTHKTPFESTQNFVFVVMRKK